MAESTTPRTTAARDGTAQQPDVTPSLHVPHVVGIGASAGGLDAFQRLIGHLPAETGLAYVLVPHLHPDHESLLPKLLERGASIPVVNAEDGLLIEADRAYVIAPNTTMTVTDGHLRLVARQKKRGPHLPIDAFLCSLAEVHGSSAVGVILSGAGSDGARGIEAVKEAGGITMVQDAGSAQYPSMPLSAFSTGAVDFVLTPEEIADQLARLGAQLAGHPAGDKHEEDLRTIFRLLLNRTAVDFQQYRRGTVHRRILRRMMARKLEKHSDYLVYLRQNPAELDLLYEELLIGVTRFFRDPDVFAMLQSTGFPGLMQNRATDAPLRIWVAGCAHGEEAYSLGIALLEFLGETASEVPIQIFGTDLSEASIAFAQAAVYPESIKAQVSPERLARFFVSESAGYRVRKELRGLCVFSRQNMLGDPPFSRLDLLSCRNVLIYFEPQLQRRVFPIFHYALKPDGLLLLGRSESVGPESTLFARIGKHGDLYRRQSVPAGALDLDVSRGTGLTGDHRGGVRRSLAPATPALPDDVESEANRIAVARFAPPGVVVNDKMEILHFRGDTTGFLTHPSGAANLQLLKLARPELIIPLQTSLRNASRARRPIRRVHIEVLDGELVRHVAIEVLPFRAASTSAELFLVVFEEEPSVASQANQTDQERARDDSEQGATSEAARELQSVRDDLGAAKRYIQDLVEEHEATAEELRAASEEIQSSNEELQSTNEELETAREEVQSTNEALMTVNEELRYRNTDLAALSSDLANVLESTTIPIVLVGRDLTLRRFTPATDRVMKVITTDAGRALGDVKLRVALPDLERDIMNTIETRAVTEQEVEGDDGYWWALTIRPYETIDRQVDGAVLVFADIDAAKRSAVRTRLASEERRKLLVIAEEARAVADEARTAAEAANRAKGTFLASMSHDLRTPLNAIVGYTELLEKGLRGPVTEAQLADFARIRRSSWHLISLINDILNFAKVEAGHLEFRMADVGVAALLSELEDLIAPQMAEKSLHFECKECDVVVHADPEKLRQIFINLLSNAVKFTPPNGRVSITSETAADSVRIVVSDTGSGIATDQLQRIFEPFVQIGRSLTSSHEGTGLGLAISRELARAMQGELTADSTVGEGSRFTLTLPPARKA